MRYYRLAENPHAEGTWVEVESVEAVDDESLREALKVQAAAEAVGRTAVHVTARADDTHLLTYHVSKSPLNLPPGQV